jgi:hypothetical protein
LSTYPTPTTNLVPLSTLVSGLSSRFWTPLTMTPNACLSGLSQSRLSETGDAEMRHLWDTLDALDTFGFDPRSSKHHPLPQ